MLNALVTLAAEDSHGEEAAHNPLLPAYYDIIWSAVCFVVILFVFWRVVLPRMQKLLDERGAAIEGNIAKADEAQRQADFENAEEDRIAAMTVTRCFVRLQTMHLMFVQPESDSTQYKLRRGRLKIISTYNI